MAAKFFEWNEVKMTGDVNKISVGKLEKVLPKSFTKKLLDMSTAAYLVRKVVEL